MKTIIKALLCCIFLNGATFARADMIDQFNVLVFTSPDRWHDKTIPIAMTQFRSMAEKHTFGLDWTQQASNFNDENLKKYHAIVFFHSRGYELDEAQMASFKKFINNGGGFVGIHASSAARRQTPWYQQLVGRMLKDHPEEQTAVMHVIDKNFPATMHLPDKWVWTEEWYSWGESLTLNLQDLITVDENTYDPDRTWGDENRRTAMGEYHPIAWYQEFDGGRSFYTTLGHLPGAYEDQRFLDHIFGGIYWAATGLGIQK